VPVPDLPVASAMSAMATRPGPEAFAATVGQGAAASEGATAEREARRSRQDRAGVAGTHTPPGSATADTPVPAPTVETALDRFYRYLDAVSGGGGRERWQQARELVNELRGMGDVAAQALMQVLAAGTDSDERRAAARLLGTLQIPDALSALRRVIEQDSDVLLRRAAASGLRQLQTPESLPVMERLLANPVEDRFVRLSAASGLAQAGRPLGVTGLTHIFEESTADGRGREMAFRTLASLNDERPLPFMRQVLTSDVEPAYRLRAIRYVTTQGDRQALAALQVLMHAPNEQPSIRDAAAQAYAALSQR
jgi:HEAT repeat protein